MNGKKLSITKPLVRWSLLALVGISVLVRCASITQPQGGPRDSLPPRVMSMTPNYGTVNFKEKRVYIEFNEYVQLKDQQKEFYTSPFMKKKPVISLKGRGILIDIKDTLLADQTYSLNFGQSVADNNEGNPYTGLRYVFSTGKQIDSLMLSGYSVDAYTSDTVGNVYLLFFDPKADSLERDSVLYKASPLSVGRAFPNGIFLSENLQGRDYRIYALEDNNSNQLYEPGVDRVAFLDTLYNPAKLPPFDVWFDSSRMYLQATPQILMRMFKELPAKRQALAQSSRPLRNKLLFYFAAPYPRIAKLSLDGIDSTALTSEYPTAHRDSIEMWIDMNKITTLPDTITGTLSYYRQDSLLQYYLDTANLKLSWKAPAIKEKKKAKEQEAKEKEPNPFSVSVTPPNNVNPEQHIKFTFTVPLAEVDSSAILLERLPEKKGEKGEKSSARSFTPPGRRSTPPKKGLDKPLRTALHFRQDSVRIKEWILSADWKPGERYSLVIPAESFINYNGEKNDTMRTEFTVADPEKFGTLVLNIQGKTPQSEYIVQLIDATSGSLRMERTHLRSGNHVLRFIDPGEVSIKIIEDNNGNGKWDTGSLTERKQPERVELFVAKEGQDRITIKENWELEFDIDMNEVFTPTTMERMQARIDRLEAIRQKKIAEEWAKKGKDKHNHSNPNQQQTGYNNTGYGNTTGYSTGNNNNYQR